MRPIIVLFTLTTLLLAAGCSSADYEKVFVVRAGETDLIDTPVCFELDGRQYREGDLVCLHSGREVIAGQIENVPGAGQRIWWLVNLEAGSSARYGLVRGGDCQKGLFKWEKAGEISSRLVFDGKPVIQYEHPVFDYNDIENTKKPFHHVFSPSGDRLITKGPGGLYPHHRGIYYGYNHVYVGDSDRRTDIWHARDGERSEHEEVLREFAGPVTGGHELRILWKDHDGNAFAEETREVRAFKKMTGEILIDFHSTLSAVDQPVRLEGDRQHAGVQFRAAQHVADNRDASKFIRPEQWVHVSPTYEIDGEDMYDLPWNAFSFKINGSDYTVSYMSNPSNPDNAEMSERLYGRFGEFFPWDLTKDNPLKVSYRFLIMEEGEPSADDLDKYYRAWSDPPVISLRD